jgi:predicted secreted protein
MSDEGSATPDPYQPPKDPPEGTGPPWEQPASGQPAYGQPPTGQPAYGQPPTGQPAYGQPPTGQPAYGQPAYGQPTYGGEPPPNYLVWAILSTIFCCLPLGIASIVFAAQVNSKWSAGDVAGAQDASRKAKQFAIWSAVAGAIIVAIYLVVVVVAVTSNS